MTKDETLRLAESISQMDTFTEHQRGEILKAAAELRRLHEELERKSAAIQKLWKERDEALAVNRDSAIRARGNT